MIVRSLLLPLLLAGAVAPAAAQAPAPGPSPSPSPAAALSFPTRVEMVTVDVVVVDKKGQPIPSLARADFQVLEDGVAQEVVSFEAVKAPPPLPADAPPPPRPRVSTNTSAEARAGRTFVVVFDDIHMSPMNAQRAKHAVAEFLRTGTREGDQVMLVATAGGAWWSTRMMAGRDELVAMLKRLDGRRIPDMGPDRMSEGEAMRITALNDREAMAAVARRFDKLGVNSTRGQAQAQAVDASGEDPWVRMRAQEIYYQSVTRNRVALESLVRVIDSLAGVRGRKSVILVSEGFVYDPHLDEFKDVVQASRRSNAAIYYVDTRGLEGFSPYASAEFGPAIDERDLGSVLLDQTMSSEGPESLAHDSGGFTVKNTNDLAQGIRRIVDETQAYYLLGYNPRNAARDGRFRKIEVKLAARTKGLKVRARRGYYAPLEGGKKPPKPDSQDPEIQQALDSPYARDEVPLRMSAWVFDETILGKANVAIVTEVDVRGFAFEEKDGRACDTLEFLLVAAHRETGEFYRYDQAVEMKLKPATREALGRTWFKVARDFELAPGGYQAKIVVRDKNSGRVGTVTHEFEVPPLGGLRLSTPVITDVAKSRDGKPESLRPEMVVRREFAPGAPLYFTFEVYGAAKGPDLMPRVLAGHTVLRPDGTVHVASAPSLIRPTSLGKLSRIVGISLEGAPAGEYVLVLRARDEIDGKETEVREPFTVVASGAGVAPGAEAAPEEAAAPAAPSEPAPR